MRLHRKMTSQDLDIITSDHIKTKDSIKTQGSGVYAHISVRLMINVFICKT